MSSGWTKWDRADRRWQWEQMYVCVSWKAGSSERLESKKWRVERAEARGSVEPVVKGLAAW